MVSDAQPDVTADVESLLERVADGRVTVQRVLEFVRGERSADAVKGSDYLRALNHVRRDLDETLVLYRKAADGSGVTAITRTDNGAIEAVRWSPHFGRSHVFEFYETAIDDCHKVAFDILPREVAKQRFDDYVREHGDVEGGVA